MGECESCSKKNTPCQPITQEEYQQLYEANMAYAKDRYTYFKNLESKEE